MRFRLEYSINALRLYNLPAEGLALNLPGAHSLKVIFRNPTEQEIGRGFEKHQVICRAESDWEPNAKVRRVFEDLVLRKVPQGTEIPDDEKHWYLDEDGLLRDKHIIALRFLPDYARNAIGQSKQELAHAIRRAVKVLRWRWAVPGPHNPFGHLNSTFSLDGVVWHSMPSDLYGIRVPHSELRLTEQRTAALTELLLSEAEEPLAHELLLEARQLSRTAPRSALLVGISALEVGVKQLIADLLPETEWLVEEAPTPPIHKILEEFLPTLPARQDFAGKVLTAPRRVLKEIQKAVFARNKLTHAGGKPLTGDSLDSALQAVEDVLWMLDYYAGREWALKHLTPETRLALTGVPESTEAEPI